MADVARTYNVDATTIEPFRARRGRRHRAADGPIRALGTARWSRTWYRPPPVTPDSNEKQAALILPQIGQAVAGTHITPFSSFVVRSMFAVIVLFSLRRGGVVAHNGK